MQWAQMGYLMASESKLAAGLAFIDIAWGSFVTAALSGFSYWVINQVS